MKTRRRLIGEVATDYDGSINHAIAERLKQDPGATAQYSGWNFCAYIWVEPDDDQFTCEIWSAYRSAYTPRHEPCTDRVVAKVRKATIEEIMATVPKGMLTEDDWRELMKG